MKQHELLAVEGQLKSQSATTRADLKATFEKKRHLFEEKRSTFVPVEEGAPPVVEQQSDIQTNVHDELKWLASLWSKAIDVSLWVAVGNQTAKADVVLDDGTTLLTAVPATALLELEKRANEILELAKSIPTLDPAKGFREAPDRGAHIYAAREVTKTRTKKTQRPLVLYPATPEHPAQTQLVVEDVLTGRVTEQEWSGLITPARKGEIINRVETLARAIKQARQRANENDLGTDGPKAGKAIFDYLFGA